MMTDSNDDLLESFNSYELDEPVARSLSGEALYPHDDACECSSPVRPLLMDVEMMMRRTHTRQRSGKRELGRRIMLEHIAPRLLKGKEYHCMSHSYLMKRFECSKTSVTESLRFLRDKCVMEIAFPAMSNLRRPAMYRVNFWLVQHQARCGSCGNVLPDLHKSLQDLS